TGDDSWGDPVNASDWFAGVVGAGLDYADAASTHTYRHEYVPALAPWIAARRKLLRRANPKRPRPLLITEFGYGGETYENSANEEYEYGLFLADFAVTALREGASGALMWCLFDTCYSDSDVHCQKWGLWRFRDQGWEPRPGYYTWSLITRFTRPGSEIIRMGREPSAPDLRAVALRSPDGALTVLIVNRYDRPISVVMDVEGRFRLYEYTPSTPLTGEMLQASRHVNLPGSVVVPRRSFLMLTDLR
ncbi:MAG TPA: hypothetical protein QGH10_02685, partial [Armatimonadota bacterium]|nr:hypothetical protein [Armatimonadota bacterium]